MDFFEVFCNESDFFFNLKFLNIIFVFASMLISYFSFFRGVFGVVIS